MSGRRDADGSRAGRPRARRNRSAIADWRDRGRWPDRSYRRNWRDGCNGRNGSNRRDWRDWRDGSSRVTVCLNMIVRDEAAVIGRCLQSVRPWIDSWCVVDTGSRDETPAIVRSALAGLPGELIERPWIDQEHNRNEA